MFARLRATEFVRAAQAATAGQRWLRRGALSSAPFPSGAPVLAEATPRGASASSFAVAPRPRGGPVRRAAHERSPAAPPQASLESIRKVGAQPNSDEALTCCVGMMFGLSLCCCLSSSPLPPALCPVTSLHAAGAAACPPPLVPALPSLLAATLTSSFCSFFVSWSRGPRALVTVTSRTPSTTCGSTTIPTWCSTV